jgi:hypothetical protein
MSILLFVALAVAVPARAQTTSPPLSLEDVMKLLEAGVSPARVKTVVAQRGATFLLNDAVEKQLRGAGATDELVLHLTSLARLRRRLLRLCPRQRILSRVLRPALRRSAILLRLP